LTTHVQDVFTICVSLTSALRELVSIFHKLILIDNLKLCLAKPSFSLSSPFEKRSQTDFHQRSSYVSFLWRVKPKNEELLEKPTRRPYEKSCDLYTGGLPSNPKSYTFCVFPLLFFQSCSECLSGDWAFITTSFSNIYSHSLQSRITYTCDWYKLAYPNTNIHQMLPTINAHKLRQLRDAFLILLDLFLETTRPCFDLTKIHYHEHTEDLLGKKLKSNIGKIGL